MRKERIFRKCRVCRKHYVPPSEWPGCCSLECKIKRSELLSIKKEIKINHATESKVLWKLRKGEIRCPTCMRRFFEHFAALDGHKGYCRKKCDPNYDLEFEKKMKRKFRDRVRRNLKDVDFYLSWAWRSLRFKTLNRYGRQCMACGRAPLTVRMHVDHIKPRSKFPELELDPENLQVLCEDCNIGKGNKFEDDFRLTSVNRSTRTILRKR